MHYTVYDQLKLDKQLCFPLYCLSKEITNRYRPYLERLDLTYPQYLVMMVLWEEDGLSVGDIGKRLHLDSGTLTPLLKRLEQKGIVTRTRSDTDERRVVVTLSDAGKALQEQAKHIPVHMLQEMNLDPEDIAALRRILQKLLPP